MEYLVHLAVLLCIYLILAQGFNLVFGVARLFNLAHVATYAIGAYTTALLSTEFQVEFFSCVVASMLLSGLLALLVGAISLRLSTDYFAIGSLAFSAVVSAVLINWRSVTRGVLGIPGIPRPSFLGIDFQDTTNFLGLACVLMVSCLLVVWGIMRSPFARSLNALAQSESAAQALGRHVARHRTWVFFISSALAGLAGSLFAYYISYIDPSSFMLTEMVLVLTIVVVGRPGSFWGVCFATLVLVVLIPEGLRFVPMESSVLGPLRQFLNALLLFSIVILNRKRLFPTERAV
jgi:branched-chain amino acid transport system permease protein